MKRKLLEYEKQAESFNAVTSYLEERNITPQQNRFEIGTILYIMQNKNEISYNITLTMDLFKEFTYVHCSKYIIKFDSTSMVFFKLKYDHLDTNYNFFTYDNNLKFNERYLRFKIGSKKYRIQ